MQIKLFPVVAFQVNIELMISLDNDTLEFETRDKRHE